MIVFLPLLIALIGMVVYVLAANPKAQELGRICFFCGLLAFLLQYGPQVVSLLGRH